MKKLFCVIICITLFTLSGCNNKSLGVTAVTTGLELTADIEQNGKKYSFYVEIPEKDTMIIKTVLPENLQGLNLEFSGSRLTVDYNDIKYNTSVAVLPKSSVINYIYSVLLDADKNKEKVISKNDDLYIEGKTKSYKYKLYFGSTGLPIKITDSNDDTTVIINNATIKTAAS